MKDRSLRTIRHLSNRQRTDIAMLLRFRTQTPRRPAFVYATYKAIAELLGRSIMWIAKALQERLEELRQ